MSCLPIPLKRRLAVTAALLAASVALTAGCSRHDRRSLSENAGATYQRTVNSLDRTWNRVKSYGYDQRDAAVNDLKSASNRADAQIDTLQADYAQGRANANGRAALQDLKAADADYHSKLDALGRASADGWNAAKQQAIASWHRLEAALDRAQNSKQ